MFDTCTVHVFLWFYKNTKNVCNKNFAKHNIKYYMYMCMYAFVVKKFIQQNVKQHKTEKKCIYIPVKNCNLKINTMEIQWNLTQRSISPMRTHLLDPS